MTVLQVCAAAVWTVPKYSGLKDLHNAALRLDRCNSETRSRAVIRHEVMQKHDFDGTR